MRIGSLCTGYGGLDHAVQAVLGGTTAWVSDIDKGACKILAHRYPGVPNLGDFTVIDWSTFEPVDVLTAGFPCQPVSHAGKRLGDNDERWLWDDVARAVGALRPGLVVLENVRGLLTAGSGRLFGRVLGALADLGYDARWHGLRAADVGAPHGRFRVFVVAYPHGEGRGGIGWQHGIGRHADGRSSADRLRSAGEPTTLLPAPTSRDHKGANQRGDTTCLTGALLPTPRTSDTNGAGQHGDGGIDLRTAVSLLPTPAVNDMGDRPWAREPGAWDAWVEKHKERGINGNGHGPSLAVEASRAGSDWGIYADAIARWEALTRPAPAPTQPSKKGTPQLSPRFSEWMLGLPEGWVTDVPGVSRNEALKAIGNGVCPQQCAAALRFLLGAEMPASVDAGARVLPTPTASDYKGATQTRRQEGHDRGQLDAVIEGMAWRQGGAA